MCWPAPCIAASHTHTKLCNRHFMVQGTRAAARRECGATVFLPSALAFDRTAATCTQHGPPCWHEGWRPPRGAAAAADAAASKQSGTRATLAPSPQLSDTLPTHPIHVPCSAALPAAPWRLQPNACLICYLSIWHTGHAVQAALSPCRCARVRRWRSPAKAASDSVPARALLAMCATGACARRRASSQGQDFRQQGQEAAPEGTANGSGACSWAAGTSAPCVLAPVEGSIRAAVDTKPCPLLCNCFSSLHSFLHSTIRMSIAHSVACVAGCSAMCVSDNGAGDKSRGSEG